MEPIPIKVGHLGIVREAAVDESMVSPESVELAINVNFDKIGAAETRDGLTTLGAQVASGEILGLTNYRNNAGTVYRLLTKVGSTVYQYNGSNWSSIRTSLSATSKARFTNFLDLTYMVDGNGGSSVETFDGTSFGGTNVGSLPASDYIENYRSRIWTADSSTDKVYYTDVVSTSQTITGGSSFIQVSPQDGEKITGLKRHPRALLVFKQNHIYKIYSTTSADPDPSIFTGTYSQESIIEAKSGIYYHHSSGFYQFVFDGQQAEISRPIIDVINAIPRTSYENIYGWSDDDHLYWSIGDITLKGKSYNNVVCRYTISTQVWTLYSYPTNLQFSAVYDNGTTLQLVVGDESGYVYKYNSGTKDNATEIFYEIQTHPLYLTGVKMYEKNITELSAVHENAQGAIISYKTDDDNWEDIGSITEETVQSFTTDAKFKKIRFGFKGVTVGSKLLFRGWEILNANLPGFSKK